MSERYDLIIKNAKIVDGTGKAAFRGSIGVKGQKIVAVGNVKGDAAREIDSSGLVACPGFIDIHNHADQTIMFYPLAENYVMQGITTFVGGNCGVSHAPIKDFIITPSPTSIWWHEIEPHTYAPPYFLSLDKYQKVLEKKFGFAIDWRTFGQLLAKVEKTGISVNEVPLVGHNDIRLAVMGEDFKRRAKPAEIEEMKKHVDEAMRSGAHGFTTNLDGIPGV
jgi:N-acyl-D-aspartate/D-glutamate deacylase